MEKKECHKIGDHIVEINSYLCEIISYNKKGFRLGICLPHSQRYTDNQM